MTAFWQMVGQRLAKGWPKVGHDLAVVSDRSSNLVNIRSRYFGSILSDSDELSCDFVRLDLEALLRGVQVRGRLDRRSEEVVPTREDVPEVAVQGDLCHGVVYPVERGGDEQVIQRPEGDIQIRVDPEVHHSEADSDGGDRRCRDGEHAHSDEVW